MCIMPHWLSTNHELFAGDASKNKDDHRVCPWKWCLLTTIDRTWSTDIFLWLLAECVMILLVANVCILLNGLEQISQIIGQLSWTREICWLKSYLEATDLPHKHGWWGFWWITNFCLERFPDDVVLSHSSDHRFLDWCFSGGLCWWGRVKY